MFTISGHFIEQLSFLIPHAQILTTRKENIVLFHVNQTLCERGNKTILKHKQTNKQETIIIPLSILLLEVMLPANSQ